MLFPRLTGQSCIYSLYQKILKPLEDCNNCCTYLHLMKSMNRQSNAVEAEPANQPGMQSPFPSAWPPAPQHTHTSWFYWHVTGRAQCTVTILPCKCPIKTALLCKQQCVSSSDQIQAMPVRPNQVTEYSTRKQQKRHNCQLT